MVADDDPDTADTLAMLLRNHGYEVAVAYSGTEAISRAVEFQPDVFILDLAMPICDGYEVARRLRAMPEFAAKHFIAVTGLVDQRHRDEASQAQFDDYLVKPCKLDLLLTLLNEAGCVPETTVRRAD